MEQRRKVKLFVASPGDLKPERNILDDVVARVNNHFTETVHIGCYRWERSFYKANQTYQTQIPEPSGCEIVIVMFANRLGSPLPDEFKQRMTDGKPYPSGTAYELLSAIAAADQRGRPDVYVFRKTDDPKYPLSEPGAYDAARLEKKRLDDFLERFFGNRSLPIDRFANTDEFETKVEALLRHWVERTQKTEFAWRIDIDKSPFRGLKAFDARQARVYFGRDRKVTKALAELLQAPQQENGLPFLLVVGASGAGKSSLVRAGLVPRLTAPGAAEGVDKWRVAVTRPGAGANAFAGLAEALYFDPPTTNANDDPGGFGPAVPELKATPHKSAASFVEMLEGAPGAAAASVVDALNAIGEEARQSRGFDRAFRCDLLVVVDQLEELFERGVLESQRVGFARALLALAETKRVWIAATLRIDLYGRMLERGSPFLPLTGGGRTYALASPGEAEFTEILQLSARAAGLSYENDAETGEALDERLLRDAEGSKDTLPLLEFSLEVLFEQRREIKDPRPGGPRWELTFDAYRKLGGLDGAIERVAERAVAYQALHLTSDQIDAALWRLLRRLAVRVDDDRVATAGQTPLTLRAAPLAEAIGDDEATRKLVDALLAAHLLVSTASASDVSKRAADSSDEPPPAEPSSRLAEKSEAAPSSEPSLRFAHEKVLTSWSRARRLVNQYHEYFRARADVEHQYRRWLEGAKRSELLLEKGKPLADAEALMRAYRDEFAASGRASAAKSMPTLIEFVKFSGRRARARERFAWLVAGVLALVAIVAGAFAWVADRAERYAASNFAAAKGAADDLVSSIAQELRVQQGISTATLNIALVAVEKLLTNMERASEAQNSIDQLSARLLGGGELLGAKAEIDHSRATLLYQFAETYHQAANNLDAAREKALASLELQKRIRDGGGASPDIDDEMAKTYMELGDIERKATENKAAEGGNVADRPAPDFSVARAWYDDAQKLLGPIFDSAPIHAEWIRDESQLLTKLGDLDAKNHDTVSAKRNYAAARTLSWRLIKSAPNDVDAAHELAWSYRKLGETQSDPAAAARNFADEVCARHWLLSHQPDNSLWKLDLHFGLVKLARAQLKLRPPQLDVAKDAASEALFVIVGVAASDKIKKNFDEVAATLALLGETFSDETPLAVSFKRASESVSQTSQQVFAELPSAEPAKSQAAEQQRTMLERGVMAMTGEARPMIENVLQNFASGHTAALDDGARACWQNLRDRDADLAVR